MRFKLGHIVATPGAIETMEENGVSPAVLLRRHALGDWGDLDDHDKTMNDDAVTSGDGRILSAYGRGDSKVWIITESDRSVTTFLRPDEY